MARMLIPLRKWKAVAGLAIALYVAFELYTVLLPASQRQRDGSGPRGGSAPPGAARQKGESDGDGDGDHRAVLRQAPARAEDVGAVTGAARRHAKIDVAPRARTATSTKVGAVF